MATWKDVAEQLFPHITETISDLQKKYPERTQSTVTRIAPSPTGFLHIGTVYTACINQKIAHQNNGVFLLRIEDTDQKRQIEKGAELIVSGLKYFGITLDEGPIGVDGADVGNYGPYTQSQRKYLYEVFVKEMVALGKAYPCWMTEQEIDSLRNIQTKSKVTPGIYGNYSLWRNKTPDEIMEKISGGEKYQVIRFRSPGIVGQKTTFEDGVKGMVNMIDNYNDIPVIKGDGLPSYHMAHLVDDYLMRVTDVIRADERLTSVPLHLQLFAAFGFNPPRYSHVSPVCKKDAETGNQRKLSKRKDPESDVQYFFQNGYSTHGILDYLLSIIDPGFEAWYMSNPGASRDNFLITIDRLSKSWILFDLQKLNWFNNNYLSAISTDSLYAEVLKRAGEYRPEFATKLLAYPDYSRAAMNIERHTEKDPKRFTTFVDVEQQLSFFFDENRKDLVDSGKLTVDGEGNSLLPEVITKEILEKFNSEYLDNLDLNMSVEDWFEQLKIIGKKYGFASNNAEFKEGGYIGKIGDLAMSLRVGLCGSKKTPDLFSVMKVMGKERVAERLQRF